MSTSSTEAQQLGRALADSIKERWSPKSLIALKNGTQELLVDWQGDAPQIVDLEYNEVRVHNDSGL